MRLAQRTVVQTSASAPVAHSPLPAMPTSTTLDPCVIHPPRRAAFSVPEPLPPILMADDDEDDTFFIARLIRKTGVPLRTFDDGAGVMSHFERALDSSNVDASTPRLMFLSLEMRGLGGFDFLAWARKENRLKGLTLVVLSSSDTPALATRALEAGAHRYLVKYPSAQTISTIVHSVYPTSVGASTDAVGGATRPRRDEDDPYFRY